MVVYISSLLLDDHKIDKLTLSRSRADPNHLGSLKKEDENHVCGLPRNQIHSTRPSKWLHCAHDTVNNNDETNRQDISVLLRPELVLRFCASSSGVANSRAWIDSMTPAVR
jgi:hypothetical protein